MKKTTFADVADDAELLHEAMLAKRTPGTKLWWNSHFNGSCSCSGCKGGKEADLLAIFEISEGHRFALHVEVKRPGDRFSDHQAQAYQERAKCWVAKPHDKVLPHREASTLVLFSESQRERFSDDISHFPSSITLEEIQQAFPHAAAAGAE